MDLTVINWAMQKASSAPSVLHGCDLSQLFRVDGLYHNPSSYQVGFIIPLNHNQVLMLVRYQSIFTMQHSSSATPIQHSTRAAVQYNQPQHLGHTAPGEAAVKAAEPLSGEPPIICTTAQALVFAQKLRWFTKPGSR